MATATHKARTAKSAARDTGASSMRFVIVEDNGGSYHWTILGAGGDSVARSPGYTSYGKAERAAHDVRDSAASARLDERGVDEGGSLAETVTT
jgi:uncharacterized protein YegP (UPF0339 family)